MAKRLTKTERALHVARVAANSAAEYARELACAVTRSETQLVTDAQRTNHAKLIVRAERAKIAAERAATAFAALRSTEEGK